MEPIQKLYIEPSTLCNLDCTMCMRRIWKNEPMGHMDMALYRKLIDEVNDIKSIHTIFFGGVGEPMFHPEFLEMVRLAKSTGKRVECVTNGSMMTPDRAQKIIEAGLDMVWFSLDGLDEKTYEGIREQGSFQDVKNNIMHIAHLRTQPNYARFKIGLTFVLMKDNVAQLGDLMAFANRCAAKEVRISHVLPYSEESMEQALFWRTVKSKAFAQETEAIEGMGGQMSDDDSTESASHVNFPLMDLSDLTEKPFIRMLSSSNTFSVMGEPLRRKQGYCRFIQENNVFVKWNGEVAPCMGLLHPSVTYLHYKRREITPKSYGNVANQTLSEIWSSEPYAAFREKVRQFDFSPCISCGGCNLIEGNVEDCYMNEHPVCGACLWAEGIIQCP